MDDKKSNVIYFQNRKAPVSEDNRGNLRKTKSESRINHAQEACSKSGHYTRVPNCIYEMGLSWQEREIWMYFNRLEPWEHPLVQSLHHTLGIKKTTVLNAIEKLCNLNMLIVEGERTARRFHVPHPIYWKHEIPRAQYAILPNDPVPPDISKEFYGVAVKRQPKRSRKTSPKGTFPLEPLPMSPKGTLNVSKGNVKTDPMSPKGTFESQQTAEPQGVEVPCKTSSSRLNKTSLNPSENAEVNSAGDEVRTVKLTLAEIEGAMEGLYNRFTKANVIKAIVREMLRLRPAEDVMRVIEWEREHQVNGLYVWDAHHRASWLSKLQALPVSGPDDV